MLASVELAESRRARARGLLGRDGCEGALVLRPARSVHTFGMRFPIDVAFCDADLRVLRAVTVPPNRLPRPAPRARVVIEAEAGALRRWGVQAGTCLELRGPAEASPGPPSGRVPGGG